MAPFRIWPFPAARPTHTSTHSAAGQAEIIYLVSMASFPNYGDELIARTWLRFLADARPEAEVWLDCRNPALATLLFEGDHPRLRTTDTIFRLINMVEADPSRGSVAHFVENLGTPHFDLQVEKLRQATTIHMLGGGYVNTIWPRNRGIIEAMTAAAAVSGARLIATGQGLTPWTGPHFEEFSHVSVRDVESAEKLGIEPGYDDAFLNAPALPHGPSTPTEVVVCIQNDAISEGAYEAFLELTARTLEHPAIADLPRTYVEAIPGFDHAGYEALSQRGITFDAFVPFAGFWRSDAVFGPHQIVISSRFHHHLMGALQGARGIALTDPAQYYSTKHSSLARLGTGWNVATPEVTPDPDPERIEGPRQGLESAHTAKLAEATQLYPAASLR